MFQISPRASGAEGGDRNGQFRHVKPIVAVRGATYVPVDAE